MAKKQIDLAALTRDDLSPDGQMIWDALGREQAVRLIEELGGLRMQVPSANPIIRRQQRRVALELIARGQSLVEVSKTTGIGLRQVKDLYKNGFKRTLR